MQKKQIRREWEKLPFHATAFADVLKTKHDP
jgi:hypothetical protein